MASAVGLSRVVVRNPSVSLNRTGSAASGLSEDVIWGSIILSLAFLIVGWNAHLRRDASFLSIGHPVRVEQLYEIAQEHLGEGDSGYNTGLLSLWAKAQEVKRELMRRFAGVRQSSPTCPRTPRDSS